jgi:predicted permease
MKLTAAFILCLICAIVAIVLFASIALQQNFPVFTASNQAGNYVDVSGNVGAEDARFMWNNDGLALIAQAFVLFAAAAATLGLLKGGEEKNA